MEYSGSGDFITADSIASESESDLFFTVPLVSETTTTEVDKTLLDKIGIALVFQPMTKGCNFQSKIHIPILLQIMEEKFL